MNSDAYFAPKDELGILGACLSGDTDVASEVVSLVQPEMLVNEDVRFTLELIAGLVRQNQPASMERLTKEWNKAHGSLEIPMATWAEAMSSCPSSSMVSYFADGIREAHLRRKLRELGSKIIEGSGNSAVSIDEVLKQVESGMVLDSAPQTDSCSATDAIVSFIEATQERWKRNGELSGVPTGIPKLDSMLDGLQYRELTLVAARPSIGKTAMGTSIVANATVIHKVPTLFVSCEMSTNAITRRLVSCVSGVPMQSIKTGQLKDNDMARIQAANIKIKNSPIHFLDLSAGAKIGTVTSAIRRAVRKHGIKLVIVDYLQKIGASGRYEKRTYEVAEVSGTLKACAASTGVAMLALAQLNRESEKEKGRKPRLSDLADSGQIERDADTVLLLDRNRVEPRGEATISIAKQRDGECGLVTCHYEGAYCRFEPALLQDS